MTTDESATGENDVPTDSATATSRATGGADAGTGPDAPQDRNSTNGSFVNDEPLTTVRPLVENDQLRVGNTILVLKVVAQ